MGDMNIIRFILGAFFLGIGLLTFLTEVIGIFKFKYVLNRMHAAGMGDTLGLSSSLLGLMIFSGINMTTLKMAFVIVFLWFTSPVCSHLLAKMEVSTNDKITDELEDMR